MPWVSAKASARSRLRAATATSRVPVAAAGPTIESSLMRAAPSTPTRSGSTALLSSSAMVTAGTGERDRDLEVASRSACRGPAGCPRRAQQVADVRRAGPYVAHGSLAAGLLG